MRRLIIARERLQQRRSLSRARSPDVYIGIQTTRRGLTWRSCACTYVGEWKLRARSLDSPRCIYVRARESRAGERKIGMCVRVDGWMRRYFNAFVREVFLLSNLWKVAWGRGVWKTDRWIELAWLRYLYSFELVRSLLLFGRFFVWRTCLKCRESWMNSGILSGFEKSTLSSGMIISVDEM